MRNDWALSTSSSPRSPIRLPDYSGAPILPLIPFRPRTITTRYVNLLKTDRTLILVSAPDKPTPLEPFPLILHRRRIAGSVIGGVSETREMLDFCATHGIESDIEVIPIHQVNEAYERILKDDVWFRFVIDLASLK